MEKYIYLYHSAALEHLPLYRLLHRYVLVWLFMYRKWHSYHGEGYQGHFLVQHCEPAACSVNRFICIHV